MLQFIRNVSHGGRIAFAGLLFATPLIAYGQAGSPFMTGATALQSNILILRCSGSEHGGTSQFASRLIGEREVRRTSTSRSRRATELFGSVTRSEHVAVESAVMSSQIEQLPDLTGYLKLASQPAWQRVWLRPPAQLEASPTRVSSADGKIVSFAVRAAGRASRASEPGSARGETFEPE
jgi:hypothetical protein